MSYSCIRDCGNEQLSRTSVIHFLFSPVSCYEPDSLKSTLCCSLSCSLILSDHTHTTVSEISNLCTHIHVPFELQTILHLLTYHYTCIYVSSINRSSQVKGSHQRCSAEHTPVPSPQEIVGGRCLDCFGCRMWLRQDVPSAIECHSNTYRPIRLQDWYCRLSRARSVTAYVNNFAVFRYCVLLTIV